MYEVLCVETEHVGHRPTYGQCRRLDRVGSRFVAFLGSCSLCSSEAYCPIREEQSWISGDTYDYTAPHGWWVMRYESLIELEVARLRYALKCLSLGGSACDGSLTIASAQPSRRVFHIRGTEWALAEDISRLQGGSSRFNRPLEIIAKFQV